MAELSFEKGIDPNHERSPHRDTQKIIDPLLLLLVVEIGVRRLDAFRILRDRSLERWRKCKDLCDYLNEFWEHLGFMNRFVPRTGWGIGLC